MDGGIFITFEGSDGCGKSTQIESLRARLANGGTERPTTFLARTRRHALGRGNPPATETFRAGLERVARIRTPPSTPPVVRNWCAKSSCPRWRAGGSSCATGFLDSTTVYQGVARRLDPSVVDTINQFAAGQRRPDVTFLLDLPPEVGLLRAYQRAGPLLLPPDRMELEPLAFYEAVRAGYLRLAELQPERFVVLDASLPPDELTRFVWTCLTERFHGLRPSHRA